MAPKNKTDCEHGDKTRWTLLLGRKPKEVYRSWGATEIVPFRYEDDHATPSRAMLRLDDGFYYYAHVSSEGRDGSVWCCQKEAFRAGTGEEAVARYLVDHYGRHVLHARQKLADCEAKLGRAQTRLDEARKGGR